MTRAPLLICVLGLLNFALISFPLLAEDGDIEYSVDRMALPTSVSSLYSAISQRDYSGLARLIAREPKIVNLVSPRSSFVYLEPIENADVKMIDFLLKSGFLPFYYDINYKGFRTFILEIIKTGNLDLFHYYFQRKEYFDYSFYARFKKQGLVAIDGKMPFVSGGRFYNYDPQDRPYFTDRYLDLFKYLFEIKMIDFSKFWTDRRGSGGGADTNISSLASLSLRDNGWRAFLEEQRLSTDFVLYVSVGKKLTLIPLVSSENDASSTSSGLNEETPSRKWLLPAKINDSRVRVRNSPSTSSPVLAVLERNNEVGVLGTAEQESEVEGTKGYWYSVMMASGEVGWVWGKYLDLDDNRDWTEVVP